MGKIVAGFPDGIAVIALTTIPWPLELGSKMIDALRDRIERLPAGIIAVTAPLVAKRLSTLTGIGAIFDSLLVSFLMRD